MSTLYAFCIGGTGAMCLESLVHLCATGQGPTKLVPVIMDPDANNAGVLRAAAVINAYRSIRASLDPGYAGGFFATEIELAENTLAWSPLVRARARTLADAIHLTAMEGVLRDLTQSLFSRDQLGQQLDQGFRGNPAIGSVLMQRIEEEPFFANITSKIRNEPTSAVFVFGSIFGGTGASGFPVTAHLVRAAVPQARIGGALILPYFSIGQPTDEAEKGQLRPESAQFLVNAAGALPFYSREATAFTSLYYLGDELSMHGERPYAAGGPGQRNAGHAIELLAALAARHFAAVRGGEERPAYYAAAHDRDVGWNDLPGLDGERLNAFTSFGIFFRGYFSRMMASNLAALEKDAFMQAWIASLELPRTFFRDHRGELQQIDTYLEQYFRWLTEMHGNTVALDLYHTDFRMDSYQRHYEPPRRKIGFVKLREAESLKDISEVHSYCNAVATRSRGAGELTRFLSHVTLGMDHFNQRWYRIPEMSPSSNGG